MEDMNMDKAIELSKKLAADIIESNVVAGDAIAAISLASSELVDALVGTSDVKREEIVATLIECITAACAPDEEH